nr:aldo/keto reductase [Gilliamella apicola]
MQAGRLARLAWKTNTLRSQTDQVAKSKYDGTQKADVSIVQRVNELAQKYEVTMTQIALAWQFAKGVTSPIIGATKTNYLDYAVGSLKVFLSEEDIEYLEEQYIPHRIVGAL